MSARTPFVAAGAIALLGGAAVAFLLLIDGSGSRPAVVEPPPPDPDAVAAAAAVRAASREGMAPEQPVAESVQHVGGKPTLPPPPAATEPEPEPKPVAWEGAPVLTAARRGGEPGAGDAVLARLEELKSRLSPCSDAEAETRPGATPPTTWGDGKQGEGDEPVFVLELESSGRGQYRIVDAPVESRGGLADGVLSCMQAILRGAVVTAPTARSGEHAVFRYSP